MTFSTVLLHKDKETIILYEFPLITCTKILLLSIVPYRNRSS
nr:MAG TPA: hypothetical protein [Crassvirales sp.]